MFLFTFTYLRHHGNVRRNSSNSGSHEERGKTVRVFCTSQKSYVPHLKDR